MRVEQDHTQCRRTRPVCNKNYYLWYISQNISYYIIIHSWRFLKSAVGSFSRNLNFIFHNFFFIKNKYLVEIVCCFLPSCLPFCSNWAQFFCVPFSDPNRKINIKQSYSFLPLHRTKTCLKSANMIFWMFKESYFFMT